MLYCLTGIINYYVADSFYLHVCSFVSFSHLLFLICRGLFLNEIIVKFCIVVWKHQIFIYEIWTPRLRNQCVAYVPSQVVGQLCVCAGRV